MWMTFGVLSAIQNYLHKINKNQQRILQRWSHNKPFKCHLECSLWKSEKLDHSINEKLKYTTNYTNLVDVVSKFFKLFLISLALAFPSVISLLTASSSWNDEMLTDLIWLIWVISTVHTAVRTTSQTSYLSDVILMITGGGQSSAGSHLTSLRHTVSRASSVSANVPQLLSIWSGKTFMVWVDCRLFS